MLHHTLFFIQQLHVFLIIVSFQMITGIFLVPLIGVALANPKYSKDVSGIFLDSLDEIEEALSDPALENKPFEKLRGLTSKVLDLTEISLLARREAGDNSPKTIRELKDIQVYRSVLPQIFDPLKNLVDNQEKSTEAQEFLSSPAFRNIIFQHLRPALKISNSSDRDRIIKQIEILSGHSSGSLDSDPLKSQHLPFTHIRIPQV